MARCARREQPGCCVLGSRRARGARTLADIAHLDVHESSRSLSFDSLAYRRSSNAPSSRRFAPPSALAASLPAFFITRPRGTRERLKTDRSAKWGARVGIFAGTAAGRTRRGRLGSDGGRGGGHERPGVYLGVGEVRGELSHGKESLRDEAKDERRADWRSATGGTRAKRSLTLGLGHRNVRPTASRAITLGLGHRADEGRLL